MISLKLILISSAACVATRFSGQETSWKRSILCSNFEELVDERALSYHISFISKKFGLSCHIDRFVSLQFSSRRIERCCFPSLPSSGVLSLGDLALQMLFKYFFCRNSVVSGSVSSAFNVSIALGYAAFLSTVLTRGD